jgi:hypothetical protein
VLGVAEATELPARESHAPQPSQVWLALVLCWRSGGERMSGVWKMASTAGAGSTSQAHGSAASEPTRLWTGTTAGGGHSSAVVLCCVVVGGLACLTRHRRSDRQTLFQTCVTPSSPDEHHQLPVYRRVDAWTTETPPWSRMMCRAGDSP